MITDCMIFTVLANMLLLCIVFFNTNQYSINNLQLANQVLIVKVTTPQGVVTKKINY